MSDKRGISATDKKNQRMSRRKFVAGAGAAALSFTVIKPELVHGAAANSKIDLGIIGCGNRGTWIARLFQKHGGYNIVAGADYFQDRVERFGKIFKSSSSRLYTGLSCYRKLLEQKLDAVAIESPPYFHPEQAAAAVDAGRHVYLAKPIAVDVPGCQSVAESGKKATANKLCFLVDFQTRADDLYREAVKRVHNGDIGRIVSGEATYQTGRLGAKAEPGTAEARLRNWVFDKALSGDIITEQNIHALDVAAWILDGNPVRAYGTGGRKIRTDVGDCWDHFAVIYTFPHDVLLSFSSKQCGIGYDDILCRVYGSEGTIDTHYTATVSITGKKPYKGGSTGNLFTNGAVTNVADFYKNVTKGRFANPTVAPSVCSNMTTILGRTAAYGRKEVAWDEIVNANEKVEADLEGLKA